MVKLSKEEIKSSLVTLIPVLIAVIPAVVALYTLSNQISQQNDLERKKVEAGYLMKALDVLHTPSDALMQLAIDTHEFKNYLKHSTKTPLENYEFAHPNNLRFQNAIRTYSDNLRTASYYAELIESDSKLRTGQQNTLFAALNNAQDKTVILLQIVPKALTEEIPIAELSKHQLYVQADTANREAAKAIVTRLKEMYGER